MSDLLTPDEQSAIASYRGKVKRIPRGVSGLETPVWDGRVNDLRYGTLSKASLGYRAYTKRRKKPGSVPDIVGQPWSPHITERRRKIVALVREGRNCAEIAAEVGLQRSTIYVELREIRMAAQ